MDGLLIRTLIVTSGWNRRTMNKDTGKQGIESRKKIYDFIVKFFTENGYAPSVREISEAVGMKSTSSVYHHLSVLEDMGKIEIKRNQPRAIKVVGYEFRKVDD